MRRNAARWFFGSISTKSPSHLASIGGKRALAVSVDFTTGGGGDSAVVLTGALDASLQRYRFSHDHGHSASAGYQPRSKKISPKEGAESDKTPISEAALVGALPRRAAPCSRAFAW